MIEDYLFLDFETVPDISRVDYLPKVKAPANYKDEEKIKNYKIQKQTELYKKMALDIDFAKIRCIGYALGAEKPVVKIPKDTKMLCSILSDLCYLTPKFAICGFNILSYDLPLMIRYCIRYQIKPLLCLNIGKYSREVYDIMLRLSNYGHAAYQFHHGLKDIARYLGIQNKYPNLDGSMVAEMDNATLVGYCSNDIEMCQQILNKTEDYC